MKKDFEEIICEFVTEHFTSCCEACEINGEELMPDDYEGSYEKALKELREKLRKVI